MNPALWNEILACLEPTAGLISTPAGDRLRDEATSEDIPKLLELLRSNNAQLRNIAVMPLIEVAGPSVLPELFVALQRDLDEGNSGSGLTGALLHLPELFPAETRSALLRLLKSDSELMRENADWLLEFCGGIDDDAEPSV